MAKRFEIRGHRIVDIPSFYAEINRVFMSDEDWQVGESLDALNDLLYGGYGAIQGREPIEIVWRDMDAARSSLGLEATRALLQYKLSKPETFDRALITRQLHALAQDGGPTYFDIILEVLKDHPNVNLVEK